MSKIIESKIQSLFQRGALAGEGKDEKTIAENTVVMLLGRRKSSAQIFRERNVDISTQHLERAIRLFIAEGEGAGARLLVRSGIRAR